MQHLVQQKADIATGVAVSGGVVTWIEQANQFVDLAAGLIAIVVGCFALYFYVKRYLAEKDNGTTSQPEDNTSSGKD